MLLFLAVRFYRNRVLAGDFSDAFDPGDLVFLEEVLDALGVLSADGAGALHRDTEVELHVADGNAEILGVRDLCGERCRFEKSLGGDTTPKDAGTAESFALDDCDGHSELGSANRADIASRTPAYENHVKTCHFVFGKSSEGNLLSWGL